MGKQIFEDWSDLRDCDDCERYYNSQCDGVHEHQTRPCTQFVAVRRSSFEKDIQFLKKESEAFGRQLKLINVCVILLCLGFIIFVLR